MVEDDPTQMTVDEVEQKFRDIIAWARARAATNRETDPVIGRASALIVTHTEDALRTLLLPVP